MIACWDRTTYHLLSDHDNETSQGCAPDTRNCEELNEAREVVALANNALLNLKLAVNVVEVAGCLDGVVAKAKKRLVSLLVAVLLHVPARGPDGTLLAMNRSQAIGDRLTRGRRRFRG